MINRELYIAGVLLAILILLCVDRSKPSAKKAITGEKKAMYPAINKVLLYKAPTGVVLGKDKRSKKYVCKDLAQDGHVFCIGGTGAGKSSCHVIPTLLANPGARVFALDIKGELSYKATKYGDENVFIFDPSDKSRYGYNPFFGLNEDSSIQQVYETMQIIAHSLIQLPAGLKDPFWKISARNLLTGLLIHYYRQGARDFVGCVDEILSKTAKESIQEVMEKAKTCSVEYRYCVQFADMAEETLGGVVAEVNNHLVIFANDADIRYAFQVNSQKISPRLLEEGKSIYLCIPEEKLTAYYDVLQLILNQTFALLEQRPENAEPILFVIDELTRILSAGKIDRLLDGARTLRSRRVRLFLITQSTEGLGNAFSEDEIADLISNCAYLVVLSASTPKTQKIVCDWCGRYRARKQSWNVGERNRKVTVTYEEKDIVEPSELMTLQNTGEAIVISPFGYCRVKKVPYYKDKYLKKLAKANVKHNRAVARVKEEK